MPNITILTCHRCDKLREAGELVESQWLANAGTQPFNADARCPNCATALGVQVYGVSEEA